MCDVYVCCKSEEGLSFMCGHCGKEQRPFELKNCRGEGTHKNRSSIGIGNTAMSWKRLWIPPRTRD